MEYRKLPHGNEMLSVLGIGTGGMQVCSEKEIEEIIRKALANGINFFDLCAGSMDVYAPFGRAIHEVRDKVYLQMHFGAVYNEKGEYAWSRDFELIKRTVQQELEALQTDYIDFGFLHCTDEDKDFKEMIAMGLVDYVKGLKEKGVIRHIAFSSHTPSVAQKVLDTLGTEVIDLMMFSINPVYDFEKTSSQSNGSNSERFDLFKRCEAAGIAISVMKPFHGGKLLSESSSPFGKALTEAQCLQYVLDRPGVLTTVPGITNMQQLDALLAFNTASAEEKDYSIIASFTADTVTGQCVYCNHCQPCPAGIDIGLVNKYYDLAKVGDHIAAGHYDKLEINASACLACGHCESRCPFSVKQEARMKEIASYFGK